VVEEPAVEESHAEATPVVEEEVTAAEEPAIEEVKPVE